MTKFDFKPGDLIEWVYEYNNKLVNEYETLWSTITNKHVPIGRELIHMCISCDNKTYSWLNERGLFSAYVMDERMWVSDPFWKIVKPRVRT